MVDDVVGALGAANHAVPDNDTALTALTQLHATTGDALGGARPQRRPHPVLGFEQVTAPRTLRYFVEDVVPVEGTPAMPSTSRAAGTGVHPPPHSEQLTSSESSTSASQGISSQTVVSTEKASRKKAAQKYRGTERGRATQRRAAFRFKEKKKLRKLEEKKAKLSLEENDNGS